MKVLNFTEFAALPPGTIYSYWEPNIATGLWRKEETIFHDGEPRDYFKQSLIPDDELEIGGTQRWGEFHFVQQYAVYEEEDLAILRKLLTPGK